MLENENMVDNSASTPVQPTDTTSSGNSQGVESSVKPQGLEQKDERRYTREEVTNLMMKRRARTHNAFFARYGVEDLKGLDSLFEKTKQYDQMNTEYGNIMLKNAELTQMNAFLRNNINPDKYDDIKAYFRGTGVDFSEDALLQALVTHPEWLKQEPIQAEPAPKTTIRTLGAEAHNHPTEDVKKKAGELLGVKF